jgi:hypothetical protein
VVPAVIDNYAVALPMVTFLISAFELILRLRVVPAPRPAFFTFKTARAVRARFGQAVDRNIKVSHLPESARLILGECIQTND